MRAVLASLSASLLLGCAPPQSGSGAAVRAGELVLAVDRGQYRAGDTVVLTLQNGLSHGVGYNLCGVGLERRVSGEWRPVQQRLAEVCTLELRTLSPGASETYRHTIPSGLGAGEYRVRTAVESPLGGGQVGVASSAFRITS